MDRAAKRGFERTARELAHGARLEGTRSHVLELRVLAERGHFQGSSRVYVEYIDLETAVREDVDEAAARRACFRIDAEERACVVGRREHGRLPHAAVERAFAALS